MKTDYDEPAGVAMWGKFCVVVCAAVVAGDYFFGGRDESAAVIFVMALAFITAAALR